MTTSYSFERKSELIAKARDLFWKTGSMETATEVLRPAIEDQQVWAYPPLIGISLSAGDDAVAAKYVKTFLSLAFEAGEYMEVILAIENNLLAGLSFDEDEIYRRALMLSAEEGDWVGQTKLALNFLKGRRGFEKSEELYLHWIRVAAESGALDPVCYYVESLIDKGLSVDGKYIAILKGAINKNPLLNDVRVLLEKV